MNCKIHGKQPIAAGICIGCLLAKQAEDERGDNCKSCDSSDGLVRKEVKGLGGHEFYLCKKCNKEADDAILPKSSKP